MRMFRPVAWIAVLLLVLPFAAHAAAGLRILDAGPAHTATVYVHGFDLAGADRDGAYGEEIHEALVDSIAALAGLPVSHGGDGPLPPNVVIGVGYYGQTPPSWFTAADRADVDAITAQWGGGVPRYAAIVAKFARRVLARSGDSQVNFVSASFGSLVLRWIIEHDLEGLASEGRIARWLTIEGLLGGNWAASHADALGVLDFLALDSIDLQHMTHDWVDAHLHLPHSEADNPLYVGILIGQVASTDERYNQSALSLAMAADRDWQPNDGVQALPDAKFQSVTARSRLLGQAPTLALFHTTHFGLRSVRGGWAEAATFLTERRRVTVRMTEATVAHLHEPSLPFWDWRPGEIVFESRVYSPAVTRRWSITDPLCAYEEAGGAAPIRRFSRDGETQALDHVVFDDLVLADETELRVSLRAYDVDFDPHYGVYETVTAPYLDDLGGGTIPVSTLAPGNYEFHATDWSCRLSVTIVDYPFPALVGVPEAPRAPASALALAPNPTRGVQRILVPPSVGATASLDILDLSGRVVRHVDRVAREGFVWDGRDTEGGLVRAGVYLVRVTGPDGTSQGRSCVIR